MKFRKILTSLSLFFLLATGYSLLPSPVLSQNEFSTDSSVTYNVQDSGKTVVTHEITLENNFSNLYATSYTLSLENIDTSNVSAKDDQGRNLEVDTQKDGSVTNLKIVFSDAVVGKGSKRHFFVNYTNGSFAVKTGEVWEVSIPRLGNPDSFRNYTINLDIPASFGLEAYISPNPYSSNASDSGKSYVFSKDQITATGITAGFGQFQVFSFNLYYHLENPLAKTAETEIALPPDTAFQKVYFSKIEPKPVNVRVDTDGNWIATYRLSPLERIDVNATGSVQIFASERPFPKPTDQTLSDNLKETQYWQVNDPQIKALAAQLKTPQAIYDYVSRNLKYDFDRVQPNVQRMGAVSALQNPTMAICMEYTDLFIALARAAGIPAREINGYAYTENPTLTPLSLVADVLHSWPEYYDKDKGVWIPVDPTWGSTTGGVDYFSKLDLRHFAFVIHGEDSTKPYPPGSYKLGPNPQKDVYVSFGKLPQKRNSIPILRAQTIRNIPFLPQIYQVDVINPGPAALYSLYPTVYYDTKEKNRDFTEVLPPYASYQMNITVPFSLLGKNTPDNIKVTVEESQITIPTNKTQIIINSLIVLCILFLIIIFAVLIRLKKIRFSLFTDKIVKLYAKVTRGFRKSSG